MLLITKVGSPSLGLRASALGACGGAFGFLGFSFLTVLSALLELAGLAAGAESGRAGRGEEGRAIGFARGLSEELMMLPGSGASEGSCASCLPEQLGGWKQRTEFRMQKINR